MRYPARQTALIMSPSRSMLRRYRGLLIAMATVMAIAFAASCASISSADPPEKLTTARRDRVEGLTQTSSWSNPKWPLLTHQFTDNERQSLRVAWGSPSVSPLGDSFPHLIFPGRVFLREADGKEHPVDWLQAIRVVIARSPNERQDWSKGHRLETSACEDVMLNWNDDKQEATINGEFQAKIPIADIERPLGESGEFQIGLSLGEQGGRTMTWSNKKPVLPDTIRTIEVPGQPVLSGEVQAINGAPSSIGWDYDPAAMIRAVNVLQGLGKDRAIEALRDYLKLARIRGPWPRKRIAASIDTSDQSCLELLIPLSFERIDAAEKLPEKNWEDNGYTLKHDSWRDLDVRFEGDIPFHVVRYGGSIGSRSTTAWLVDWADDHGRLRQEPLKPVTDPLEAAERICDKTARRSGMDDDLRRHIRSQALRMAAPLLDEDADESNVLDIEVWTNLKPRVAQLQLKWDTDHQRYTSLRSNDKSR